MEEPSQTKALLIRIWPSIYRIINSTLYFLISLVKSIVKYSVRQIKDEGYG